MFHAQFHDLAYVSVFAFHPVTSDGNGGAEPLTVGGLWADTAKNPLGTTVPFSTKNVAPFREEDSASLNRHLVPPSHQLVYTPPLHRRLLLSGFFESGNL
jgi:hypothetical protein